MDIHAELKKTFGFSRFMADQEEIVCAIMEKRDVFASMPTGGGKSLCYQLPAFLLEGTCVVISPLIALMKDQVDAVNRTGIRAEFINSTLSQNQISFIYEMLERGEIDLLYIAPERFSTDNFLDVLKSVKLSFFAVDEAHCVSEWGHDFRPDYLHLSKIKEEFNEVPVSAFTATATKRVEKDIIERLSLRSPFLVRASFNRPNLFYRVLSKDNVNYQILNFIRKKKDEPGIVYRTTRKSVEETADFLVQNGIKASPYHAGLDNETRKNHQESFSKDEVQVVVATIAFGMGIDKSNIRFVIHGDLPKNMEGYYQETGRSGRDGEPAECLLFFGYGDIPKMRYFINQVTDEMERKNLNDKLNSFVKYATVHVCRRKQILRYFNEDYGEESCGACDVCTGLTEKVDGTVDAQIVMSAIVRTGQRFGAGHIADIVTGAKTKRIRELRHDEIKTYGTGSGRDKKYWRSIIDELLAQECLSIAGDRYPVLVLTKKGTEVLYGRKDFFVLKKEIKESRKKSADLPYNTELFEILRELRRSIAAGENIPPYIVFSDRTLREMCRFFPVTDEEMLLVSGVGEMKLERYGKEFSEAVSAFLKSHPEIAAGIK